MKIYRIRVTTPTKQTKVYKVKADSYSEAEAKLRKSFIFEEMLSDDEIKETEKMLDKLIELITLKWKIK